MNHEIIKEGNKVVVRASVPRRKLAKQPVESINTEEILEILRRSGYNLKKYRVIKQGSCSNYKPESKHSSEWVLELIEKKEEASGSTHKQPVPRNRKRTRAVKENQLLRDENLGGVRSQAQTDLSGQDKEISGE